MWGRVVVSISGGLLLMEKDGSMFKKYAEALSTLKNKVEVLVAVAGGGSYARDYIEMARNCGLDEEKQDIMGIAVTRVNALLLSMLLNLSSRVPESCEEVVEAAKQTGFVVCGGMKPGQSTDKVAADIATMLDADVVLNATKVDGLYTKNPEEEGAELLREATYDEMRKILSKEEQSPGKYALFDLSAIDLLEKHNIPLIIFNGKDVNNLLRVVDNHPVGTIIKGC